MSADHLTHDAVGRSAGHHILLDMYECRIPQIDDLEKVLTKAADEAGTTLIKTAQHVFTNPEGKTAGDTAIALLEESHISIHTWPEHKMVLADIFTCGNATPLDAARVLIAAFKPTRMQMHTHRRGDQIDGIPTS